MLTSSARAIGAPASLPAQPLQPHTVQHGFLNPAPNPDLSIPHPVHNPRSPNIVIQAAVAPDPSHPPPVASRSSPGALITRGGVGSHPRQLDDSPPQSVPSPPRLRSPSNSSQSLTPMSISSSDMSMDSLDRSLSTGHSCERVAVGDASESGVRENAFASMMAVSRSRVSNAEAASSADMTKTAKRRSCMKCGDRDSCPGRREVELCPNRCRDCGKTSGCLGRDSKHPNKKCWEVYEDKRQKKLLKDMKKRL